MNVANSVNAQWLKREASQSELHKNELETFGAMKTFWQHKVICSYFKTQNRIKVEIKLSANAPEEVVENHSITVRIFVIFILENVL